MKNLVGVAAYILSYPLLFLVLRGTRRTRVVLIVENEVLLLKPVLGLGTYILPGGGLKKNEIPVQSAARELREETGIALRTDEFRYTGEFTSRHNFIKVKLHIFRAALSKKPEIRLHKFEIAEFRWVDISQLDFVPMTNAERRAVRRAAEPLS